MNRFTFPKLPDLYLPNHVFRQDLLGCSRWGQVVEGRTGAETHNVTTPAQLET